MGYKGTGCMIVRDQIRQASCDGWMLKNTITYQQVTETNALLYLFHTLSPHKMICHNVFSCEQHAWTYMQVQSLHSRQSSSECVHSGYVDYLETTNSTVKCTMDKKQNKILTCNVQNFQNISLFKVKNISLSYFCFLGQIKKLF